MLVRSLMQSGFLACHVRPEIARDVLRAAGVLAHWKEPDAVDPYTQASVPGVGRIDLVVRFVYPDDVVERWFEVKVHAAETGDQLSRYRAYLETLPGEVRPVLATIAKRPIRDDGDLPFIPWEAIRRAGRRGGPYWRDLADWLEEVGMASVHEGPITPTDITSLAGAVALYEKLCRVLADLSDVGRERFPMLAWPVRRAIRGAVEGQLSHRGRFVLHVGPVGGQGLAYLFIGAWTLDGSHVGLWVESNPKYGPQRRRIIDAANANGLPGRWLRRLDTWKALTTELEPTGSLAQSDLVAWYADRLAELEAAGVLDLLPVLSKGLIAEPAVAGEVDGMTP